MTLHVQLSITGRERPIAHVSIGRIQHLDLSDKDAIADVVSDYRVRLDGTIAGEVEHRYGDGAFELVRKAMDLMPAEYRR